MEWIKGGNFLPILVLWLLHSKQTFYWTCGKVSCNVCGDRTLDFFNFVLILKVLRPNKLDFCEALKVEVFEKMLSFFIFVQKKRNKVKMCTEFLHYDIENQKFNPATHFWNYYEI